MEDHVIETFSATLLFIGCGVFIRIFTKLLRSHRSTNLVYPIISLAFVLSLFVMGMEEISWFQRILLIDTPQAFEGNVQGELNLHNFATNFFHTAYFFLAFILFVLLPFLNEKTFLFKNSCLFAFFIPSRFVLFASAIFVAYTYGNWSEPLPQLSFFITLFILMHYAWVLRSVDNKLLLPTLVAVYVLTQTVFLGFGDFVNPWEIGEYKEFFIPLSFVIYSLEILHRTNALKYCDAQKTI
ncbi:hypothetical protein N9219_04250 [bacterium]|nr:hypothetical protein [bacterium]